MTQLQVTSTAFQIEQCVVLETSDLEDKEGFLSKKRLVILRQTEAAASQGTDQAGEGESQISEQSSKERKEVSIFLSTVTPLSLAAPSPEISSL